jgi:hypothetical protein
VIRTPFDRRRRLAWKEHAVWLGQWLRLTPEARDARGTPFHGVAEQTDAAVRHALERFDLEDILRDDATAAFVAFTVAETLRGIARDAALQAEKAGLSPGRTVTAVLTAALQRFAWHAAGHYAPAYPQPEPFGAPVDTADLPPMVTPQEEPAR